MRYLIFILSSLVLTQALSAQPKIALKATELGKYGYVDVNVKDYADAYGGEGGSIISSLSYLTDSSTINLIKYGVITDDTIFIMKGGVISDEQIIKLSKIIKEFYFSDCKVSSCFFESEEINYILYFENCILNKHVWFLDAKLYSPISFVRCKFGNCGFSEVQFKNDATFFESRFDSSVDFSNATFFKKADFWRASFKSATDFSNTNFKNEINLTETSFTEPVDFRLTGFDSTKIFYLEDMKFRPGALLCSWKQFKSKDSFRINLGVFNYKDPKKDFVRLEKIYESLRDNFFEQKKTDDGDEAMYELASQRKEKLSEFKQIAYGFFMGFGYKPWRFLLFALFPCVFIFAGIYYWFYNLVFSIIYDKEIAETSDITFKRPNWVFQMLHLLYFSSWILFSLRINKEWLTRHNTFFVIFIISEYLLGLFFFILFAYLIMSSRYDFIKSIIGF